MATPPIDNVIAGLVEPARPVIMVQLVIIVRPVVRVGSMTLVEAVIVGPVILKVTLVVQTVVMVQLEVHTLVIVWIVKAELPLKFPLVIVLVVADICELTNICRGNSEMVIVNMTVLKLVSPVNFPSKVSVHHVFESKEVVASSDVAVLPVTMVKVHETRCDEMHVEVVIVGPVEVHPVSSHSFEVTPVKVAPCEECESTEVDSSEVNVSEPAPSKVVVVEVFIVVTIKGTIVKVSINPLHCTHLSPAECEVIKSTVIEPY